MELGQEAGQGVGLGDRRRRRRRRRSRPGCRSRGRRTRCPGRRPRRASRPSARLGPSKARASRTDGGRRAVIDPQGQQLHGDVPSRRRRRDRAVRRGQPQHLDAHPGEDQERERHDRQHHHAPPPHRRPEPGVQEHREDQPHHQRADDLGIGPAERRRPAVRRRAARLEDHADQQAERQQREGQGDRPPVQPLRLLEARQREPEPRRPLVLEPVAPGPGTSARRRTPRTCRPPRPAGRSRAPCPRTRVAPPQSSPSRPSRGARPPATTTRASTSGSTNSPTATGRGERTIRYRPISARIHDRTSSDSNTVVTGSRCARPRQVGQVGRLHEPAQRRQPDGQVPPRRAADHEPGQLAQRAPGRTSPRNKGPSVDPSRRRSLRRRLFSSHLDRPGQVPPMTTWTLL